MCRLFLVKTVINQNDCDKKVILLEKLIKKFIALSISKLIYLKNMLGVVESDRLQWVTASHHSNTVHSCQSIQARRYIHMLTELNIIHSKVCLI